MGKTSTTSKRKYNEKSYDRLAITVKKGERDKIKAHAESKGLSLNAYINALIKSDMDKKRLTQKKGLPHKEQSYVLSYLKTWKSDYHVLTCFDLFLTFSTVHCLMLY